MSADNESTGKGPARSRGREAFWRRIVVGQPGSGLSIRQWCQRRGVTEPSFYAWRRELARRDAKRPARGASRPARFVALHLADGSQASPVAALRLVVDDLRIEIGPGFDGDTLRRLVTVLRAAAPC